MPNPIFSAMNSGTNAPMCQQFSSFMQMMRGVDPKAEIERRLRSGQVTQQQLNAAQQQAQQAQNILAPFFK